jgi:DNA-binding NarL/FixJ family response regulator
MAGCAANGPALLEHAPRKKPRVVILDPNALFSGSVAIGWELRRSLPQADVMVLTMSEDCKVVADVLQCYSVTTHAAPELVRAIYEAVEAKSYPTPKLLTDPIVRDPCLQVNRGLTQRQGEVLRLLVEGRSMKEVAATLNVSTRTVAFHKYQIMDRFGLKSNIDLVRLAIKKHLIDPN